MQENKKRRTSFNSIIYCILKKRVFLVVIVLPCPLYWRQLFLLHFGHNPIEVIGNTGVNAGKAGFGAFVAERNNAK